MSGVLVSAVLRTSLPHRPKFVLVSIVDQMVDESAPFMLCSTLAARASLSVSTVGRALRELEALGYLRRMARPGRSSVLVVETERLGCSYRLVDGRYRWVMLGAESASADPSETPVKLTDPPKSTPVKLTDPSVRLTDTPVKLTDTPVRLTDISGSYPGSDTCTYTSERRTVINDRSGAPRPEAGGSSEGGAKAPPPESPRPAAGGGSTVKPATLHIQSEPSERKSFRAAHPELPVSSARDLKLFAASFGRGSK